MPFKRLITTVFIAVALGACTVGPDYKRSDFLDFFQGKNEQTFKNTPQDGAQPQSMNRWWERIEDPQLSGYIDTLLAQNLQLRAAAERVIQARENSRIARSALAPSLSQDNQASRSFSSISILEDDARRFTTSFESSFGASWILDVFGKVQRSIEAGEANLKASLYDREALSHALIAELLQYRVAIAINKEHLELAQNNAKNREIIFNIVKNRYEKGVRQTSLTDVYLAQENYTTTKSNIPQFELLLANDIYSLDVLLGQMPGTSNAFDGFPLIPPPRDFPVCLPADLLDRRPDLRSSELRLKAANANIGVAIADLYPSFNLAGSSGFSGESGRNFFSADQLAGSLLGSITTRIFEGGALRRTIRLRESQARELSADYARNVLRAVRDVESALKAEIELEKQLSEIETSNEALKKAENISQERYIRGIVTLQEFLDIQQRRYAAQQSLLNLQEQRWNNRITLYLALGGDWFDVKDKTNRACSDVNEQKQGEDL